MGLNSEDAYTTELQTILRIAHAIREATAISCPSSLNSLANKNAAVVIDPIASPQPLLPFLLEAGIAPEIASAASQIYQRRAEELKQHIQESIAATCRKAAEFPASAHRSAPESLMKKVVPIFTDTYFRCLEEWKEEIIRRFKEAPRLPVKVASRNSRTFNQEYVPLLEHFFEQNPFPTHADKLFLAKKSNMEYRQIHVWFQNRRNRTRKEGKTLTKKPMYEGAMKALGKLYGRTRDHMIDSNFQAGQSASSEGIMPTKVRWINKSKDAFASSSPPHAFPSPYPPTCNYDPFPCKSGPVHFRKPEWRRVSCARTSAPLSISIDNLIERLSRLNVRDETRSKGSPKQQSHLGSHAATVAITVVPSRAPHPSLIVCKYYRPTNIVQLHPSVRAPASRLKVFESPSPTSKPVTLVPPLVADNKTKLSKKRRTAPLPQRFPGRMRNTSRDTSLSESSSTSSSSPGLFSEGRGYSFSSTNSLFTPSSIPELPCSLQSSCRSPFVNPIHLHNLGDMVATSPPSIW